MRWRDGQRTHYLHIVVADGVRWHDRIAFGDGLRNEPALAQRYAELEAELAARHRQDREACTKAKTAFARATVPREARHSGARGAAEPGH